MRRALTTYEFVIDSHAWIEYFRGTEAGRAARAYVEGDGAATSTMTLANLREKYAREHWAWFDQDLAFVTTRTQVVPLDRALALMAGQLNYERKSLVRGWGMADSVVLATARSASAKVVTGDRHFEGLPDAIMLP